MEYDFSPSVYCLFFIQKLILSIFFSFLNEKYKNTRKISIRHCFQRNNFNTKLIESIVSFFKNYFYLLRFLRVRCQDSNNIFIERQQISISYMILISLKKKKIFFFFFYILFETKINTYCIFTQVFV